jgi:hypothetical protein
MSKVQTNLSALEVTVMPSISYPTSEPFSLFWRITAKLLHIYACMCSGREHRSSILNHMIDKIDGDRNTTLIAAHNSKNCKA